VILAGYNPFISKNPIPPPGKWHVYQMIIKTHIEVDIMAVLGLDRYISGFQVLHRKISLLVGGGTPFIRYLACKLSMKK
jgi:hypothetical protein